MKRIKTLLYVLSVFSNVIAPPLLAQGNGVEEVNQAFMQYNAAIIQKKGEEAASFLSEESIASYSKNVKLALRGKKEEIKQESLANQVQILIFRHRIPAEVLKTASGKEIFIRTVNEGWLEKEAIEIQHLQRFFSKIKTLEQNFVLLTKKVNGKLILLLWISSRVMV